MSSGVHTFRAYIDWQHHCSSCTRVLTKIQDIQAYLDVFTLSSPSFLIFLFPLSHTHTEKYTFVLFIHRTKHVFVGEQLPVRATFLLNKKARTGRTGWEDKMEERTLWLLFSSHVKSSLRRHSETVFARAVCCACSVCKIRSHERPAV